MGLLALLLLLVDSVDLCPLLGLLLPAVAVTGEAAAVPADRAADSTALAVVLVSFSLSDMRAQKKKK